MSRLASHLCWQETLEIQNAVNPIHYCFTPKEAREFIRTIVAVDTLDDTRHTDCYRQELARESLGRNTFPKKAYENIERMRDREREELRMAIKKVLFLKNANNDLCRLLPIEVLMQTLALANNLQLFSKAELRNNDARNDISMDMEDYTEWKLYLDRPNISIEQLVFGLGVILECPPLAEDFHSTINQNRVQRIGEWNTRQRDLQRRLRDRERCRVS